MTRYAQKTKVGSTASVAEIERTLTRYGATGFAYGRDDEFSQAFVGFKIDNIAFKIFITIPDRKDYQQTDKGRARKSNQAHAAWEQAYKQRWRALALVIKAKLEAVESGISSIEAEFLPHILLPNNQTIADLIYPQLQGIIESGKMPALLTEFKQ